MKRRRGGKITLAPVDVLVEQEIRVADVAARQDGALAAALGDVLVLLLLRVGEVVVLGEQRLQVARVGLAVVGLDQADAAAGNVAETDVEAAEVA